MRRILFVLAVAGALAVLLPALLAYGDTAADNTKCLSCHGPSAAGSSLKVDFAVGAVDRSTACNKCHWISPHPYHNVSAQCASCHVGWPGWTDIKPPRSSFFVSQTPTAYGYFTSLASPEASPADLHAIHSNESWPARLSGYNPNCTSCHAPAACSACHSSTVGHTAHSSGITAEATERPVFTQQTLGQLAGDTSSAMDKSVFGDSSCGAQDCHGAQAPHDLITAASSRVSYTGTWTDSVSTNYKTGLTKVTIDTAAALEFTFSGSEFSLMGRRSSRSGIAKLYVDGILIRTINLYGATSNNAFLAHVGGLSAGTHVVRLENTATKSSLSRGYELSFQSLDARSSAPSFDAIPACATCHFTFEEHYDPTAHLSSTLVGCGGEGCHNTPDLMSVHNQRNPSFTCSGCHDSILSDVQAAIVASDTSCNACHSSGGGLGGHRGDHNLVPPFVDALNTAYYSYYLGSGGSEPTGDCATCHAPNLMDEHLGLLELGVWLTSPRTDDSGNPLSCDSCHAQAEGTSAQVAIAAGVSACEACHAVHGPIAEVHASDYVDAAPVPCGNCHSSDLTVVHGNGYTSSAGLTGCAVCHGLYTGELGALVQNAITATGDTKCTACHPTYHLDTALHRAGNTASLGCGGCHARGLSSIEVATLHGGMDGCSTCHGATSRVGDITTHTAECASCHTAQGVDYHRNMAAAHRSPVSTYETCSGCHHSWGSNPLQGHDITRHSGGCTTCHNETYDLTGKTALCSNCHLTEGAGTPPEGYHVNTTLFHSPLDPTSEACGECHRTTNVRELHVAQGCSTCHNGRCQDCHAPHNAMGGALLAGTSCSRLGCHVVEGADYHTSMISSHTFTDMPQSCSDGLPCHQANTLAEEHERYAAQFGYVRSCDLCHWNVDPTRIPATATADCSSCHVIHAAIDSAHTSVGSVPCLECHESADVRAGNHGSSPETSCDFCHAAPVGRINWANADAECSGCHPGRWPVAENHYSANAHQSTLGDPCVACHDTNVGIEHSKESVSVDCVTCHEGAVDGLATEWDGTCAVCHPDLAPSHPSELAGVVVVGVVTDASNGTPISGAVVSVNGTSVTSSANGSFSIPDVTAGSYTMSVSAIGYSPRSQPLSVAALSPLVANASLTPLPPTNLALAATATASSMYNTSTYGAARAADGNLLTYWRSASAGSQWLRMDMGAVKTCNKVVLNWYASRYASSYRIETSVNGTDWTQQYVTTAGGPSVATIEFERTTARYVRLVCTVPYLDHYRIAELEVWGY